MNMKKYIKPDVEMLDVKIETLLELGSVEGLDGVTTSPTEFPGGSTDSRVFLFDDEE